MEKILVFGASGHAKVIIEAIELNKKYQIAGLIDSYRPKSYKVFEYEVLGDEYLLPALMKKGITKGIIAIGDNWIRHKMYQKIHELVPDFEFITVIHPSAIISEHSKVGKGTVILASGTVNADAEVGDFCIINTNANFGHDSIMEDFSSLAPGVTTGGTIHVGEFTAISIGVTIIQNLSIGKHCVIGAGAVVTSNISDNKLAYGVPAKVIKERNQGEPYLYKKAKANSFKVAAINDIDDISTFKQVVDALGITNPFYKTELLDTTDMHKNQLCYFVYAKEEQPIIVMPFYVRDIVINNELTAYKDVTSPYGYSGPLFNNQQVEVSDIRDFWTQVDVWYRKKNIISEFIRFSLTDNHVQYTGKIIESLQNVKGNIIADKEQQWAEFKSKVRNNYRKSIKQGLELKVFESPIDQHIIKDFYDIYIQTMRRHNAHSQYFHYIDYFEKFIKNNPESAVIAMVYKDDMPISTELILLGDTTLYSYLGGTLSDYFFTRPNDFLKIEMMNWARVKGYKHYILGGGRENNDSLYNYKKSFFPNDEDVTYYTGRKIINAKVYESLVEKTNSDEVVISMDEGANKYFPLYRYNS